MTTRDCKPFLENTQAYEDMQYTNEASVRLILASGAHQKWVVHIPYALSQKMKVSFLFQPKINNLFMLSLTLVLCIY
jgi:hypothetical protein